MALSRSDRVLASSETFASIGYSTWSDTIALGPASKICAIAQGLDVLRKEFVFTESFGFKNKLLGLDTKKCVRIVRLSEQELIPTLAVLASVTCLRESTERLDEQAKTLNNPSAW
jgi:hypothetical protein